MFCCTLEDCDTFEVLRFNPGIFVDLSGFEFTELSSSSVFTLILLMSLRLVGLGLVRHSISEMILFSSFALELLTLVFSIL